MNPNLKTLLIPLSLLALSACNGSQSSDLAFIEERTETTTCVIDSLDDISCAEVFEKTELKEYIGPISSLPKAAQTPCETTPRLALDDFIEGQLVVAHGIAVDNFCTSESQTITFSQKMINANQGGRLVVIEKNIITVLLRGYVAPIEEVVEEKEEEENEEEEEELPPPPENLVPGDNDPGALACTTELFDFERLKNLGGSLNLGYGAPNSNLSFRVKLNSCEGGFTVSRSSADGARLKLYAPALAVTSGSTVTGSYTTSSGATGTAVSLFTACPGASNLCMSSDAIAFSEQDTYIDITLESHDAIFPFASPSAPIGASTYDFSVEILDNFGVAREDATMQANASGANVAHDYVAGFGSSGQNLQFSLGLNTTEWVTHDAYAFELSLNSAGKLFTVNAGEYNVYPDLSALSYNASSLPTRFYFPEVVCDIAPGLILDIVHAGSSYRLRSPTRGHVEGQLNGNGTISCADTNAPAGGYFEMIVDGWF